MSAADSTARPAGHMAARLKTILVIAVTAVVIGAVAFVVGGPGTDGVTTVDLSSDMSGSGPSVGEVPPPFTAGTFDGKGISLSDYAGKPLWLTFGASWCPDCRSEAPDVEAAYQKYKGQGLQVVAVFSRESPTAISSYAQRAELTFPIAVDQSATIASAYRILGIPTHFFIGADGRIRAVRIGALHPNDMDTLVASIMH